MKKTLIVLSITGGMLCGMQSPTSVAGDTVITATSGDQNAIITVKFLIRSDQEKRLERAILAASDPDSPRYGHYLTDKQLDSYRPKKSWVNKVVHYLEKEGYSPRVDRSGHWVETDMTVAQAAALAGVVLSQRTSETGQTYWVPNQRAMVPAALQNVVEVIMGLDQTPVPRRAHPGRVSQPSSAKQVANQVLAQSDSPPFNSWQVNAGTQAGCAESRGPLVGQRGELLGYTPNQWLHAYGIDQLHAQGYTGQGERLALIELGDVSQSDLDGFTTCFDLPRQTPPIVHAIPEGTVFAVSEETMLDLEILSAVAPGLERIDIYEAGSIEDLGLAMLEAISQPGERKPTVISISLGLCEAENNLAAFSLWERANRRAAAQGISVFVSTGDQGPTECHYDAPWGRNAAQLYSPDYPASSPWVTAVGGTNLLLDQSNQIVKEIPWNNFIFAGSYGDDFAEIKIWASTSGTSAWFTQPAWQTGMGYSFPAGNLQKGRVVPDVALLADGAPGYAVLLNGQWLRDGGTSAATPLMAGGVTLINQALRSQGKRRVGYLNPQLYHLGKNEAVRSRIFTDVTEGNNDTMWQTFGTFLLTDPPPWEPINSQFEAKPGFDGASGWGSPKLPAFLEELKKRR